MVTKIERRLADWKKCYPSKEGKINFLKALLASIPRYFLSLFVMPKAVEKK